MFFRWPPTDGRRVWRWDNEEPAGWRFWRVTRWAVSRAYVFGLVSGSGSKGHERGWFVAFVNWRGKRPYVFGFKRAEWGYPLHWLRYGHWPETVWMGLCGKCGPWQCCGATGFDHLPDCPENPDRILLGDELRARRQAVLYASAPKLGDRESA